MLASLALAASIVQPPNIVLVLSDDSGYGDFSCYGSTVIPTPNIDALAKAGVRFTQGYVSAAVCSPSRAGLLTGRYQQRFGHEYNLPEPGSREPGDSEEFMGLPISEKTIADRLKGLGYTTGAIGKWHLGEAEHFFPTKRGFDEFTGFRTGSRSYFYKEDAGRPIESNVQEPQPFEYLTDYLAQEASRFIDRHSTKPFFLYVAFNATHTPMHTLPEDEAAFPYLSNTRRRKQAAMMRALDRGVGTIDAALQKAGVRDNTLFVFLNDNGGTPTTNGSLNAPLNGMKGTFLEGGIRVPFVMRWPGRVPAKSYDAPVSALDLAPTFVAAAGGLALGEKESDGVDLLPFLTGAQAGRPHSTLFWRLGFEAAVREGDWKLIRVSDRPAMLYNLSTDISEQSDLAAAQPERVRAMLKQLFAWETTLAHPVFRTAPMWIKQKVDLYDGTYNLKQPPPPQNR